MKNTEAIELGTGAALVALKTITEQPERNADFEKHALVALFQQALCYLTADYTDAEIKEITDRTIKLHRKTSMNSLN